MDLIFILVENYGLSGVIIFLLMMATAFVGYVLPWSQMTFWGATVITNLFSAVPLIRFYCWMAVKGWWCLFY